MRNRVVTASLIPGGRTHLPPLKPPDLLRNILLACGIHDPAAIEEWLEALSRVRHSPGKRPADAPIPYRGLASFQPDDADWFYGRQKLIDVVAKHLGDQYLSPLAPGRIMSLPRNSPL
jgi:hypothetical protein